MDDAEFIAISKETCEQMGDRAVLLLVGSRAAGFTDSFSDLDVWILGDKAGLTDDQRKGYDHLGMLTNDSFGGGRHWVFYDIRDMVEKLEKWPSEKMWTLATSQYLHGCSTTAEDLKKRYAKYPRDIAERKLKWLFGKLWQLVHSREIIARQRPISALLNATQTIECLAKLCCVAECKAWPYDKWLADYASQTELGKQVFPFVERTVAALDQVVSPPDGVPWQELTPSKELGATWEVVKEGLPNLGWESPWIDRWWEALADTFDRPSP